MSIKTLNFAINRNSSQPVDHLFLIIVADKCGKTFTLNDVLSVIERHTRITKEEAIMSFNVYSAIGIIQMNHVTKSDVTYYSIVEFEDEQD